MTGLIMTDTSVWTAKALHVILPPSDRTYTCNINALQLAAYTMTIIFVPNLRKFPNSCRQARALRYPSASALPTIPAPCAARQGLDAPTTTNAPGAPASTQLFIPVPQVPLTALPGPSPSLLPNNDLGSSRPTPNPIPTPVRHDRLRSSLILANFDPSITRYLADGFQAGFSLRHDSTVEDSYAQNSPALLLQQHLAEAKILKEVSLGRIAGPFPHPPFHPFHISPLGLREKKIPGTYRLIHNLSYPYDDQAINFHISDANKTVQYASITDAIHLIMQHPFGSFTAKTDIADAFRLLPINPQEYHKLGFQFKGKYYYDRCLPMGCSSSCAIFECFATALQALFQHEMPSAHCLHMLDDFFFIAPDYETCLQHLNHFINMCSFLGVPIAPDKTTPPSTNTTFLGVELDTTTWTARLPPDKLQTYASDLLQSCQSTKLTKKQLQSLIGKLSFATSVVPARPFLRRLIDLLPTVSKPHYFIRLTHQVKQDLNTWLSFLSNYNGLTFFRSLNILDSPAINMVSDASKLGFGACYGSQWIQAAYPLDWQNFHITVLELYPIYVLIHMFGHLLVNHNILFHCDNLSVTAIINSQTSKDKTVMAIIRPLILALIKFNISLKSKHVSGATNILPDRISRFQVTPQLLTAYGMRPDSTPIPQHLLPGHFTFN